MYNKRMEVPQWRRFPTQYIQESLREEAIREITGYIEIFYNRERIQERLGYLSPANYMRQFYEMRKVA